MAKLSLLSAVGIVLFALTACDEVPTTSSSPAPKAQAQATPTTPAIRAASRSFVEVVKRMEPVTERECRARTKNVNCDFRIVVDDRPDQPPNAFQPLDRMVARSLPSHWP